MTAKDDIQAQLITAYNADAERRKTKEKAREAWKLAARETFANLAKAEGKRTVLEIGAGVGSDAKYFVKQGFEVLASDLSPKMVDACREKGLQARVLDIYKMDSLEIQFDAIYSLNVLLHIPAEDLPQVLEGIYDALQPNGLFFYGVYGGTDKSEVHTDPTRMNLPRFFSFLSDETLQQVTSSKFKTVETKNVDLGDAQNGLHFQSLLLRKQ